MPRRRIAVRSRFYRLIDRTPACWIWIGARSVAGYGTMVIEGRTQLAHRVSWELHNAPLLEGARIRHVCGERTCVRPDHLELAPRSEPLLPSSVVETFTRRTS